MKRVKKLLSVVVVVSMLGATFLTGCSPKENTAKKEAAKKAEEEKAKEKESIVAAEDVASALYKLVLQGEDKEAKELGYTDDEVKQLKDKQKNTSVTTYKNSFLSAGVSLSQSDAEALYNAEMKALKKLTFTVEVKNESDSNCNVVIKTDTIDVSGAAKKASENTVARVKNEKITSMQKAGKILFEEMKKQFAAIKPNKEQQEITAAFVLEKVKNKTGDVKMWVPKNSITFGAELARAVEQ